MSNTTSSVSVMRFLVIDAESQRAPPLGGSNCFSREIALRLEQRKQSACLHQAFERFRQRLRRERRAAALIAHRVIVERHFCNVAFLKGCLDAAALERRETEIHAVAEKKSIDRFRDEAAEPQVTQRARRG